MKMGGKSHRIHHITMVGMCVTLITLCSWIYLPMAIPFTLQTLGVFTVLGLLGGRLGSIAVSIYLLMGGIGIPVFSGFRGGIGHILQPTGGFLVGFLLASLTYWLITNLFLRFKYKRALGMVLGQIACYITGTVWFIAVNSQANNVISVGAALITCVLPFILPDILKIGMALILSKKISAWIDR